MQIQTMIVHPFSELRTIASLHRILRPLLHPRATPNQGRVKVDQSSRASEPMLCTVLLPQNLWNGRLHVWNFKALGDSRLYLFIYLFFWGEGNRKWICLF